MSQLVADIGAPVTWPRVLANLLASRDLSGLEARWAMTQLMSGEATNAQAGAFLAALKAKGESVSELRSLSDVMYLHAVPVHVGVPILDIVGTGGDGANTVNISTMASIVAAACGVPVVKHGNRAASSAAGTADTLEALGIDIELTAEQVSRVLDECGISFCFARSFHPAMRFVAPIRSELGVPTAFNVLGPLTNPARPEYSAVGCGDLRLAPVMAGVFAERSRAAVVFRGRDGLDEVTLTTTTDLWWVGDSRVTEWSLTPAEVGLPPCSIEDLRGTDVAGNARTVVELLDGAKGPIRDTVMLNAGVALALVEAQGGQVSDLPQAVRRGITRAAQALDSGAARTTLQRWLSVAALEPQRSR